MDITIFTIAYNGYAKFLEQWINNLKDNTTKPKKVVIVLGKNHGGNLKEIKKMLNWTKYDIIESDSDNMGYLRNQAIKVIDTSWMLYFSADDKLLPNAIEEIKNTSKNCSAVCLNYIDKDELGVETPRYSASFTKEDMMHWNKKFPIPGYIAVKRKYKNKILYYSEIEIPNFPYLFMLADKGVKVKNTSELCAIYLRRKGSHGDIAFEKKRFVDFSKVIDKIAYNYYNNKKQVIPKIYSVEELKNKKVGIANIDYEDKELGCIITNQEVLYEEEKYNKLINLGYINEKER